VSVHNTDLYRISIEELFGEKKMENEPFREVKEGKIAVASL
jgi:hypothetical protein